MQIPNFLLAHSGRQTGPACGWGSSSTPGWVSSVLSGRGSVRWLYVVFRLAIFLLPTAQECRLVLLDLEAAVGGVSRSGGGQQAGSIGIALEGTTVSGLVPFGPAYGNLEVGDVIVAVDGEDVTPGTVVSAIAGEEEGEVQLLVRRRGGEKVTMDLVRTCSARLLTAHSLSVNLHNALIICGGGEEAQARKSEEDEKLKNNPEACELLQECARLLQDLQTQVTRTETRQRQRLNKSQKRMFLHVKQMQEHLQAELSSTRTTSNENVDELKRAKEQAEVDRETLMAALKDGSDMLEQLENQLSTAMARLDHAESKLAASVKENRVLLNEVERLGHKQTGDDGLSNGDSSAELRETIRNQDLKAEQLRSEVNAYIVANTQLHEELEQLRQLSSKDGQEGNLMLLVAENSRLKEVNSSHQELLQQASQQLHNAQDGELEVRSALLQSQQDIARLLRIAEDNETKVFEAQSEKERISKEHEQACTFADSVKGEIKRLEGLLDTLGKRQAMASVVVESLTNERDELKLELDIAKKRFVDLEKEVGGFKKLCSAQKQILQESSDEIDTLRKKLLNAELELKKNNQRPKEDQVSRVQVHSDETSKTNNSNAVVASCNVVVVSPRPQHSSNKNDKNGPSPAIKRTEASSATRSALPSASSAEQYINEQYAVEASQKAGSLWAQASKGGFKIDIKEVALRNEQLDYAVASAAAAAAAANTSAHTTATDNKKPSQVSHPKCRCPLARSAIFGLVCPIQNVPVPILIVWGTSLIHPKCPWWLSLSHPK